MDSITFATNLYWNRDSGHRSFLYYAYLLQKKYNGAARADLPAFNALLDKTATLEAASFNQVTGELANANIIYDPHLCHLLPQAVTALEEIFIKTFGTADPDALRYNGLKIIEGTEGERVKTWVERASEDFVAFFHEVDELKVENKDTERKAKRVMSIETNEGQPFQCWLFMSTPRMTRSNESHELLEVFKSIRDWRAAALYRGLQAYTAQSVRGAMVIAALTYDPAVASEIMRGQLHSIGPINFGGVMHYLESHQVADDGSERAKQRNRELRVKQYYALLDALLIIPSGVVFSNDVIGYMNNTLADTYAELGITL